MPPGEAIAYFLDADELNNDNSNYWILSIPALRRMVKRASWTTLNEVDMGDTSKSRPNTLNHDERLFLLLESRCGTAQVELLDGWWHAEETGWRWTRQQFSARVNCDRPSPKLVIDTYIAPVLIEKFETVTLSLTVDGVPLAPARFTASGDHTVTRELPSGSAERVVSFSLAHVMREQAEDARELGIIVTALRVD
jgi:hypothetical protein